MTDTTSLAKLDVDRDLALSDEMLVPVAFREPLPRKTVPHRRSRRLVLTLGIALFLIAAAAAYGELLLDGRAFPGIDRRRLCAGRFHDRRPQSVGLL